MNKMILRSLLLLAILGLGAFLLSPAQAQVAQAQAGAIVYNLFATDGYVELADGNEAYIYGFVGGRAGGPFTYQTSYCTGDGTSRACQTPMNVTLADAPAPTGGPWTGMDIDLAGNAQFPAPIIYAAVGDVVEIRLKNLGVAANPNAPNDPHSIHLHGLDVDAANDGVPETSVGAVPANMCADGSTGTALAPCADPAPGAGNVIVYMFTAAQPGTSMYHCHQEADIHVNMGMYGALVVYNPTDPAYLNGGPGQGFGGNLWGFQYDKDYIMLLSEFDVRGHADEEGTYAPLPTEDSIAPSLVPANSWDPFPYNWALYQPQYWFVNGLSFPNTIHANLPSGYTFENWKLAHPGYDPLITGSVSTPNALWGTPGEKVLIRVINMGFETQPMHMHGYHGKIIGSDQRVWDWANKPGNTSVKNPKPPTAFGFGLEKNTLTIGSGETYEWLVDFGQQTFQSIYEIGTQTRYYTALDPNYPLCAADVAAANLAPAENEPISNTFENCPVIPDNGAVGAPPYIGGPTVTDLVTSQYFPFHNHDDYKATNNGLYPGGMFTMLVPTP